MILTRQGIPSVSDLRNFDRAHRWMCGVCPEHTYREAIFTTALAASSGEIPRETIALPCPHEFTTWRTDDPARLFTVAMDKARRLQQHYGDDWDQIAPEGPVISELMVFVAWWWYVHPARIGEGIAFPARLESVNLKT